MDSNDNELNWNDLAHWLTAGRVSEATLATAIEQQGIWGFDRFGRFRHFPPEKADAKQVTDLSEVFGALAANYAVSLEQDGFAPVENLWGTEVYCRFGWIEGQEPDFAAVAAGQTVPPASVSSSQRASAKQRERTELRLIGGMLEVILGETTTKPHPQFKSQADLIEFLGNKLDCFRGLGKRSLETTFARARRAVAGSDD